MTGPFDDGLRQGDAPMEVERVEPSIDYRVCICGLRWLLCPDRNEHNKTEVME